MTSDAIERTTMQTDSPDRSVEVISSTYAPVHLTVPDRDETFRFRIDSRSVDGFRFDRLAHSSGYLGDIDAMGFVAIVTPIRGEATYSAGRQLARVTAHQSVALPHDRAVHMELSSYDLRLVTIPAERIIARARDLSGDPSLALHMDLALSHNRVDESHWRATVDFLHRELGAADSAMTGPLFRQNALLLLVDAALALFPNNLPLRTPLAVGQREGRRVVARAIEYIEANARNPITDSDIAVAAEVDSRVLRDAFAQQQHTSPAGYVQLVRLQGAARELRDRVGADHRHGPSGELDAIVKRWGFGSSRRFRASYRASFGMHPDSSDV